MSLQKELEDQIQTCKIQCIGLVSFICLIAIASAVLLITGHRILGVSCAVAVFSLCLDLERNQRKWDNLKIELEKAKENNRTYKYCAKCGAAIPSGKNFCVECGEHLPEQTQIRKCAKCGAIIPNGKNFCVECGEHLPEQTQIRKCAKCGATIPTGKNFCVECGEHL